MPSSCTTNGTGGPERMTSKDCWSCTFRTPRWKARWCHASWIKPAACSTAMTSCAPSSSGAPRAGLTTWCGGIAPASSCSTSEPLSGSTLGRLPSGNRPTWSKSWNWLDRASLTTASTGAGTAHPFSSRTAERSLTGTGSATGTRISPRPPRSSAPPAAPRFVGWLDRHLLPGADLLVIQRAGRAHFIGGRERYGFGAESRRRCGARTGADVQAFALRAEQDQECDRVLVGAAEPVWGVGVELGDFAWAHDDVQLAEEQPQLAVEHIHPLVALMNFQLVLAFAGRDDDLVGLHAARVARQRQHGSTVASDRFGRAPGVAGGRFGEELVDRHVVGAGQPQQQLQGGFTTAGLESGQGAHRHSACLRELRQGGLALFAHSPQPRTNRGKRFPDLVVHESICRFGNAICQMNLRGCTLSYGSDK